MNKILSLSLLLVFLGSTLCFAQKSAKTFKTNAEYCDFLEKKFDIPRELVLYVSDEGAPISEMQQFGQMLFVSDGRIAKVEDVRATLGSSCSPKQFAKQVTQQAILQNSGGKIDFSKFVFKEVATGKTVDLSKEEKFALYVFSLEFGKSGLSFFKQRKELASLGYKSFVLTIDGAYLDQIKDVDKTPVVTR